MTTTDPQPDLSTDPVVEPLNDALLLQAVRDGSTAAFGILYARYRAHALQVARRAMPRSDPALAEDVVEVAFVRVLTALRNGKGPADSLRAYLTTTVRREVWRSQRRIRKQAAVVDRWAVDEGRPEPDPSAAGADGSGLGTHALLVEAFRSLSERWRQVLWLTEIEGRKPADLSGLMGISAASASALAYRARNGLITAYFGAYARTTSDETCAALADQLGRYLAAGRPDEGFTEVVVHLDGCADCRDASRGIDVAGATLASLAPFGLLSTGLWAKAAASGAAGLAGAAGSAATAGVLAQSGTAAGTSSAAAVGVAAGVVAAVAVAAGVAWASFSGSSSPGAAPPTTATAATAPAAASGGAPSGTSAPSVASTPALVPPAPAGSSSPPRSPSPTTSSTSPSSPTTTRPASAPGATPASPSTTVSTTAPAAPPVTRPTNPSTTAPQSTSTTTTSTTPVTDGQLTGRAIEVQSAEPQASGRPVPGVSVVAYDVLGRTAGSAQTDAAGRWAIEDLEPGWYLVVAEVPSAYRPYDGVDTWVGGETWTSALGFIELGSSPIDLVDLRLAPR